jgi:hypothetical protein
MLQSRHMLQDKIGKIVADHEKRQVRLQPFMVIVGDLKAPESFYLVVTSDLKYHLTILPTTIEAPLNLITLDKKHLLIPACVIPAGVIAHEISTMYAVPSSTKEIVHKFVNCACNIANCKQTDAIKKSFFINMIIMILRETDQM